MKIGNNYSEFLDKFTKNHKTMSEIHSNIADKSKELNTLVKEADEAEKILLTNTSSTSTQKIENQYDDFLDKFAKKEIANDNRIKQELFKFFNTEHNRDNHVCELILKKAENKYKIKLTHYSGSFDYAAFQSIWHFSNNEEKTANKVFDTLTFAINGIKEEHNKNQKNSAYLTPVIRESVKTIAESYQFKKNAVHLNESDLQSGESNWEKTIYGNKYPENQEEAKQKMIQNNHSEGKTKRTFYTGRSSKITKEI